MATFNKNDEFLGKGRNALPNKERFVGDNVMNTKHKQPEQFLSRQGMMQISPGAAVYGAGRPKKEKVKPVLKHAHKNVERVSETPAFILIPGTENNDVIPIPAPDQPVEINRNRRTDGASLAETLMENASFCVIDEALYCYSETERCWKYITEAGAKETIRILAPSNMRRFISNNSINEIYYWLKVIAPKITDDMLITRKQYINFRNGTIDWESGKKNKNPKELYCEFTVQCDIPDEEECERMYAESRYKKYMETLFASDVKQIKVFEEIMGICCTHIRDKKMAVFLYGSSNTGKSVMLNLMSKLIGKCNTSSISFSQMSEVFAVVQLCGKWLNISGEISGATNKRLDILKSLTGNDPVTACFKGKDFFEMRNKAFLLFACNTLPEIDVESVQSVYERVVIFDCNTPVPRSEWVDDLENLLYEECEIIMWRAMKGLRRLKKRNFQLEPTKRMIQKKQEYLLESNSFIAFARDHICADSDGEEASSQIEEYYRLYCEENNVKPLAANIWSKELQKLYSVTKGNITSQNRRPGVTYNARGYKGISLCNIEHMQERLYPTAVWGTPGEEDDCYGE